jgi:hypothetical protein
VGAGVRVQLGAGWAVGPWSLSTLELQVRAMGSIQQLQATPAQQQLVALTLKAQHLELVVVRAQKGLPVLPCEARQDLAGLLDRRGLLSEEGRDLLLGLCDRVAANLSAC